MRDPEKQPLCPANEVSDAIDDSQRKTHLGLSARQWLIGAGVVTVVGGAIFSAITLVLLTEGDDLCITPGASDSMFTKSSCPDDMIDCGDSPNYKMCKEWCYIFAKAASKAVQTYCSQLPGPPSPLPPG